MNTAEWSGAKKQIALTARKKADYIIASKEWSKDSAGLLVNGVIKLLIESGMIEGEAYQYLEI